MGKKFLVPILIGLAIAWAMTGITSRLYELRDADLDRGAVTKGADKFGDHFF